MSRVAGPYHLYKRTDKRYRITLYPVSGLPVSVCAAWVSKSFANLPPELAQYREPRTKAAAQTGATLLIEYLKRQLSPAPAQATSAGIAPVHTGKLADMGLVEYLLDFWRDDSAYVRKKAKIDGEALSRAYVKANRHDIETHVKTYPDFRGLPIAALTAGMIEDWKLWTMET